MIKTYDKFNLFSTKENNQNITNKSVELQQYGKMCLNYKQYLSDINETILDKVKNLVNNVDVTDLTLTVTNISTIVNNEFNKHNMFMIFINKKDKNYEKELYERIYEILLNNSNIIDLINKRLKSSGDYNVNNDIIKKLLEKQALVYVSDTVKNYKFVNSSDLEQFMSIIERNVVIITKYCKLSINYPNLYSSIDFKPMFENNNITDIDIGNFMTLLHSDYFNHIISNQYNTVIYNTDKSNIVKLLSMLDNYCLIGLNKDRVKGIFNIKLINNLCEYVMNNSLETVYWNHILPHMKNLNTYILENWENTDEYLTNTERCLVHYLKKYDASDIKSKINDIENNILLTKDIRNLTINIKQRYEILHKYNNDKVGLNTDILHVDGNQVNDLPSLPHYKLNSTLQSYETILSTYYEKKYPNRDINIDQEKSIATVQYNDINITGPLIYINVLMIINDSNNATIENIMGELCKNNENINEIEQIVINMQKAKYITYVNHKYNIGNFVEDTVLQILENTDNEEESEDKQNNIIMCHIIKYLKVNSTKYNTVNQIIVALKNKYDLELSDKQTLVQNLCKYLIEKSFIREDKEAGEKRYRYQL